MPEGFVEVPDPPAPRATRTRWAFAGFAVGLLAAAGAAASIRGTPDLAIALVPELGVLALSSLGFGIGMAVSARTRGEPPRPATVALVLNVAVLGALLAVPMVFYEISRGRL